MQAAKRRGCSVEDIQKGESCKKLPSLLRVRHMTPLVRKLRAGRMPGDMEASIRHTSISANMFKHEPGTEMLSILGKYEPWKDALWEGWRQLQGKTKARATTEGFAAVQQCRRAAVPVAERAEMLFTLLEFATLKMDGIPQTEWNLNCGRKVCRVLGWLPLLSDLGAVKHWPGGQPPKGKRVLQLGTDLKEYQWLPKGRAPVVKMLERYAMGGDCLADVMTEPPRTCALWLEKFTVLREDPPQLW